ncbi:TPA: MerR family transcriptional regulator [Candidatus Dependentiae bacterium]|nr:MAG: Transcriptional regulator (MerR family) protein [candidate division TM6 bacterium GW2011_GWF2_43_87]HBL98692.1 MerR family transcriptional regulator [Candidatus Dependentiae bacterium]
MKKKKGYFSISAVAEMFSVHQQTIRLYEREGLISPRRSEGNTRLFSEEDIQRLEEIIYLTHKLGINLAGVEMILKQQRRINKLQREINIMFKRFQQELEAEKLENNDEISHAAKRLSSLKSSQKETLDIPLLTTKKNKGT